MQKNWWWAIVIFGVSMMLFDTHYIMQNYLPATAATGWGGMSLYNPIELVLLPYAVSLLRFIFGIPLIFLSLFAGNNIFGTSGLGTAAASATVMYTLLIPYLAVLSFFLEGKDGIPPGYRLFQFFISRSGKEYIERATGSDAQTFDAAGFHRATKDQRTDKYQAKMEKEELHAATAKMREDTKQRNKDADKIFRAEADRVDAAEQALKEAERNHRAKARERAYRDLSTK